jgi:hypothetical protein
VRGWGAWQLFVTPPTTVPPSQLIVEIILYAEGFKEAQVLSHKVVTMARLMQEKLSKQQHYDEGLRAIKAVVTRAGALYRAAEANEEVILQRAMRVGSALCTRLREPH